MPMEWMISTSGQVPIPFVLFYSRASVNSAARYAVDASISEGGRVVWRTTNQYPVLTQGNPSSVNLEVTMASDAGGGTRPVPAQAPRVIVGGNAVAFVGGQPPYRAGNTWMMPIRPVLNAAGVQFTYTGGVLRATNEAVTLRVSVPGRTVTFSDVSRRTLTADVVMRNSAVYAPIEFLEMATLSQARYNQQTNTYTFVKGPA